MRYFIFLLIFGCTSLHAQQSQLIRTYDAPEAGQAVAVDATHFYAIDNMVIAKYQKSDGVKVAEWRETEGIVKHLNSGIVLDELLYCANSNYPDSPMASSIEIFNTADMSHHASVSLGIFIGSATWIDRHDDGWWIGFAHYSARGSSEGKDNRWTSVVSFNDDWQRQQAWVFPDELIQKFSPSSNSGAAWADDGRLYCTGHDAPEVYVMDLPERGYTLSHLQTIGVPFEGQGIAWDKQEKLLYGISRKKRQVLVVKLPR